MHLRNQIRDQIKTQVTGLTTTGSNVFSHRVYPVQDTELPAIIVYTSSESAARATLGGFNSSVSMLRTLNTSIEVYVKATSTVVDTLDTIAEEIEAAMGFDETLNGLAEDLFLVATSIEINGDGEQPIGVLKLDYDVAYRTTISDPTNSL